MTGSDMGGLAIGFCIYLGAFFGALFGVGAVFTSGSLQLILAVIAVALLAWSGIMNAKLRRQEKAQYESRQQSELARRRNNPFYDALCTLGETLRAAGLTRFTTGQRSESAVDGSGKKIDYLLVRVQVEQRDSAGVPTIVEGGMPAALWQNKVPAAVGNYAVRLEFFD